MNLFCCLKLPEKLISQFEKLARNRKRVPYFLLELV